MKILLVVPQFDIFPVGIAYISAALKQAGHSVDCFIFDEIQRMEVELANGYDFVATGGLSSQFEQLNQIAVTASRAQVPLIAGGGIITSEPELMSRSLSVRYAVIGEGEDTICELFACLERGERPTGVAGIGYFEGDRFVLTPARKQREDLDVLPWPDFEGFNFGAYLDKLRPTDSYIYDVTDSPREYPLISSRSCPFLCTFCYHPVGDKYRQRSLDSIMAELEVMIPRYRINILAIYDELFSYEEERVYEFCRRFKAFTDTLSWQVGWFCQMRVAGLKDEMLDAMRVSGCFMVSYGFESYSPVVLRSMRKHISPEQIHQVLHATLDRKISIQANFIFVDPAETIRTALETLEFWKEHQEAGILLGFILAIPDSALYRLCIEKGIITDRFDYIKNHLGATLNMTSLSEAEFYRLRSIVYQYTHRYSISAVPLNKTKSSVTVSCPHCAKTTTYNNYRINARFYRKMIYCRNCRKRFFLVSISYKVFAWLAGHATTPIRYNLIKKIENLFLLIFGEYLNP